MKTKVAILVSTIVALIAVSSFFHSKTGREVCYGPGRRIATLRSVAIGSAQFFYAHGSMPGSFSQLYPDYIDTAGIFFTDLAAPPSPNLSPDLIDSLTHYRVMKISDSSWIFYEQPGVYADGSMTWVQFVASEDTSKFQTTSGTCSQSEVAPFFRKLLDLTASDTAASRPPATD
ncbi:MAG: hypothetical protein WD342_20135 [Verrucomicrobiales bacterium]